MIKGIESILNSLSNEINPDYISIYNYFTDYLNTEAYTEDIDLDDFLRNEFSKSDIVNSCVWYFEKSNAQSETAIKKYLNAMTTFYSSVMKPKGYDNKNLFVILPFSKLHSDVRRKIKNKEISAKIVFPTVTNDDFKLICKHINEKNSSIIDKQISIIFKLLLLYGLKYERIKYMEKAHFDSSRRLLTLKIADTNNIILELPYHLTLEIERYLQDDRCNKTKYMFLNTKEQIIQPTFLSYPFRIIKGKNNIKDVPNRFTSTGLAKYAIINMIKAGINVPVIKIITGMEDDVITDCTKEVNELDNLINLNRDINSRIRSIATYDEIGNDYSS